MIIEADSIAGVDRALRVNHDAAHYLRVAALLVTGCASVLFLAWFMVYLIQSSDMMLSDTQRVQMLDFVRVKRDENIERKDRTPERPKLNEAPEVPPLQNSNAEASGELLTVTAMPTETGVDIGGTGVGFGSGEGEYLPIVKVAPIYPENARRRQLEGECMVEYTVTGAGTVRDVKVLKDECTNPVFYRPSIEAAKRFKYKPRVINGEAVEVHGVLNLFTYSLED